MAIWLGSRELLSGKPQINNYLFSFRSFPQIINHIIRTAHSTTRDVNSDLMNMIHPIPNQPNPFSLLSTTHSRHNFPNNLSLNIFSTSTPPKPTSSLHNIQRPYTLHKHQTNLLLNHPSYLSIKCKTVTIITVTHNPSSANTRLTFQQSPLELNFSSDSDGVEVSKEEIILR